MCISSTSNQYIKQLQHLIKQDNKNTDNFYIENYKNIQEFLKSQEYKLLNIFVSKENINTLEFINIKNNFNITDEKLKIIDDNLWNKINKLTSSPRIIAIFAKPESSTLNQLQPVLQNNSNDLLLILDNIQDPGNLGSILRTALATSTVNVICTKGTVNIYSSKVLRASASSIVNLNIIESQEINTISEYLKENNYYSYITRLEDSTNITELDLSNISKRALIMGNEGHGISSDWQELLYSKNIQYIKIPMNKKLESLNVAVSSALCLYKMQKLI